VYVPRKIYDRSEQSGLLQNITQRNDTVIDRMNEGTAFMKGQIL
jgi:hypothetical protein